LSIASTNRALAPLSTTRKVPVINYRHARCCVALFQRKSLDWFGDDDLYLPFEHYTLCSAWMLSASVRCCGRCEPEQTQVQLPACGGVRVGPSSFRRGARVAPLTHDGAHRRYIAVHTVSYLPCCSSRACLGFISKTAPSFSAASVPAQAGLSDRAVVQMTLTSNLT